MKNNSTLLILIAALLAVAPFVLHAQTAKPIENSNLSSGVKKQPASASEKSFFDLFQNESKPVPTKETKQAAPASPLTGSQAVKPAVQAPESKVSLTNEQRELTRLQYYLNSISTIVADFTQIGPDGGLSSGKFYLKRPGKMRWQYAPPTPILIIANGKTLVYYDYELEQVSQLPIDSTLASLLAREKIDLNDPKLKVDSLTTAPGALRITLSQRNKPEEGSLLLEFSDQPLQIRNMVITDAQKQVTTVSLNKAQFGKSLEDSLFIWKDPRSKR